MSALGSLPAHLGSPEVMNKILLRSSTPASNEKVLLYLEGMQSDPPDPDDRDTVPPQSPRSQATHPARVASPLMKGSTSGSARPGLRTARSGRSELSYVTDKRANGAGGDVKSGRNEDIRSDIQEGRDSDLGTPVPIRLADHHVEPGPDDGPGVRYESLGSSFGNFGQPPWDNQTSPGKAAGVPLPVSAPSSDPPSEFNPFQQFGMTPAMVAGVASRPPASPVTNGRVASPVNGSKGPLSQAGTRASHNKSPPPATDRGRENGNLEEANQPQRALSRSSKVATNREEVERPWSPRSGASHTLSRTAQKSRVTDKYPPLPESRIEEESDLGPLRSVPPQNTRSHRAPSKASSLAPSDSPSVAGQKYARARATSNKEPSVKSPRTVQPSLGANGEYQESRTMQAMSPRSQRSRALSPNGNAPTVQDLMQISAALSPRSQPGHLNGAQQVNHRDPEATPTPSRPHSTSNDLDEEEQEMVRTVLSRTPRTSCAPSALEPEVQNSHFHDMELCELLHSLDGPSLSEVVKKAVRKAVRARVKKLGMKSDNESIRQYRKSFHDHDPRVHLQPNFIPTISEQLEPPDWAKELMDGMVHMQKRLDVMAPKIERMKISRTGSIVGSRYTDGRQSVVSELDRNGETPMTQTIPIYTQPTGTIADESTYHPDTAIMDPTTIPPSTREEEEEFGDEDNHYLHQDMTRGLADDFMAGARNDSPGQQYLEEELYKLRVKTGGSQSAVGTHKTWEVAREDGDYDYEPQQAVTESGMPEIPDTTNHTYTEHRQGSPSLPPIPQSENGEMVHMPDPHNIWHGGYGELEPPPWQRIHQRLLNWAIIWPMSELEQALSSTTRGHQVDEIALSIWSTQSYKRYVRSKMTDSPPGRVDRLFVPPNVADAISTAVFNGRHGDACMMLRDLWAPFGLDGIPRLLIVLAKHRTDENHWVVHRFSLPDGQLTTYDTYPEKCLPDGRPLGWWFAIRIAWPDANYPSPDNLMQKMVRLHRPLQLGIDNSVAAAGIWRNLLMGSRAERSVDLERLRDLINTEVKNLRQRKQMGKLSIGQPKPTWEDMN